MCLQLFALNGRYNRPKYTSILKTNFVYASVFDCVKIKVIILYYLKRNKPAIHCPFDAFHFFYTVMPSPGALSFNNSPNILRLSWLTLLVKLTDSYHSITFCL